MKKENDITFSSWRRMINKNEETLDPRITKPEIQNNVLKAVIDGKHVSISLHNTTMIKAYQKGDLSITQLYNQALGLYDNIQEKCYTPL